MESCSTKDPPLIHSTLTLRSESSDSKSEIEKATPAASETGIEIRGKIPEAMPEKEKKKSMGEAAVRESAQSGSAMICEVAPKL